jgi:predicted nucleotidyltransferase
MTAFMRPSVALDLKRNSDLDLLVDALPGATLFDLGGLQDELEALLGVDVDRMIQAGITLSLHQLWKRC